MRTGWYWVIGIFLCMIILGAIIPDENYKYNGSINITDINKIEDTNKIENLISNIDEPHFSKLPITFNIDDSGCCIDNQEERIMNSLELIKNSTEGIVYFEEVDENPDILFSCIDVRDARIYLGKHKKCEVYTVDSSIDQPLKKIIEIKEDLVNQGLYVFDKTLLNPETQDKLFNYEFCYINSTGLLYDPFHIYSLDPYTLAHGGPVFKGNILENGSVIFYDSMCLHSICKDFPAKEIHEILHVFAFDHTLDAGTILLDSINPTNYPRKEKEDIMHHILDCKFQNIINDKYSSCLKYIYSNGESGNNCSDVNFIYYDVPVRKCPENTYEVEGSDFCCPEPNMILDELGFCIDDFLETQKNLIIG